QAGDGIRDFHVTGVQTCALPICAAGLLVVLVERLVLWPHGGRISIHQIPDCGFLRIGIVSPEPAASIGSDCCAVWKVQQVGTAKIGRASCREGVYGWAVRVQVRE